jgi:hypothetical protein
MKVGKRKKRIHEYTKEIISPDTVQRSVENYMNGMCPITKKESKSLHKAFLDEIGSLGLGPLTELKGV